MILRIPPLMSLLILLATLLSFVSAQSKFTYTDPLATNLLDFAISPFVTVNGSKDLSLPACARDCIPLFVANSYCTSSTTTHDSLRSCFCTSQYLHPFFYDGTQCAFLCGRDSRNLIIEWLTSDVVCGKLSPLKDVVGSSGKTVKDAIPPPESFTKPSSAEKWWSQFDDGRKFGITLGIVLAFLVVSWLCWLLLPKFYVNWMQGRSAFLFWRIGQDVKSIFEGRKRERE